MAVRNTPFYKKYKPYLSNKLIERTMCIRRSHGYIYFRIPKAANTMIASNLYFLENRRFDVNSEQINAYKVSFERPSTLADDEIDELERFFKFTVVRNPATRILSCYLQKIHGDAEEKSVVTKSMGVEESSNVNFEDFLDWLGQDDNLRRNYHWSRQNDLIPIGVENLDYLGKVETLVSDLEVIMDRIFGPGRSEEYIDFSPGKTYADKLQNEYFTPSVRKKISELYEPDFTALGYDPLD